MSIKLMAEIWERQIGPGPERDVLMIYCDHAGDDGRVAWPTVATVAWKAGYSERQVQRIIRRLQGRGILQAVESNKGEKRGVRYRVNLDAIPRKPERPAPVKVAPKSPETPVTGDAHLSPQTNGRGDTYMSPLRVTPICHPTGDMLLSPKPSIQPSSKPPTEPASAGAGSGQPQKLDATTDFFNRAAAANERAAGDEKARLMGDARKVFGKWNLPAHLNDLAAAFVDVFCVGPDNAGKGQEGKWVAGLNRLYGQHPTLADLQAARKRAADARPAPLTITHPGAIVETLKAIQAERMARQAPQPADEEYITIIDRDGYERDVRASQAHLFTGVRARV